MRRGLVLAAAVVASMCLAGTCEETDTDGGRRCCTDDRLNCVPFTDAGACEPCCRGDVCGFPRDDGGACRSPNGPPRHDTPPPPAEQCPGSAPSKADFDQGGGWKPPPAAQTVCSAGDITAFEASFKSATSYSDLIKGLPTACGSCILGKEADATWNFVVTDDRGELRFLNYGACYARAAGGSDACGKAVQYDKLCISASCSDCPSASESTACLSDTATETACSANFAADIKTDCGADQAKLESLADACRTPSNAAAILCGNGNVTDGGGGG
jgi:hypothetical protein